jgi:glycerate 2-kinase
LEIAYHSHVARRKSSAPRLRRIALRIFRAALGAAQARAAVTRHLSLSQRWLRAGNVRLPLKDFDRIFLIAAGKASNEMAAAVEEIAGSRLTGGIVVSKHLPQRQRLRTARILAAEHPIPGIEGMRAAAAIRELLRELNARDLLLVAISGGASALLPAPSEPITLAAKQRTTELLLRAGANIRELNAVRKHLSMLKGGRLAALAYPATVVGLLLSDVVGDRLDVIGSGLTAPDESTFQDALAVLEKFDLMEDAPPAVRDHLLRGIRGEIAETPKPNDPIFENVHNLIIGSNRLALEAAAHEAKALGYRPVILSSTIEGEAREVARVHAEILREAISSGNPAPPPVCILSGGETTVTVRGNGRGGRCQEFALAAALAMDGLKNAIVLSAGADGTDGPTDAAGAVATGNTLKRARRLGLDARAHLAANNSYAFFDSLGDLVRTGPTGTNVMDVYMLLADRS